MIEAEAVAMESVGNFVTVVRELGEISAHGIEKIRPANGRK